MASENGSMDEAGVLTATELTEFEQEGLLRLKGAIPADDVRRMRDHLWRGLAEFKGIARDNRETWPVGIVRHLQQIQRDDAFAAMGSANLCATLDALFGAAGWRRPSRWGELLVTFPTPGIRWNVPNQVWHFDVAGEYTASPALMAFALLDAVLPGGGGTPVVTGSHRLLYELAGNQSKISSARARKLVAQSDRWIADLWSDEVAPDRMSRYMEQGAEVQGVRLRVREICGEAGDVFLMHVHLLHTVAVNARTTPRLFLKQGIYRATAESAKAATQ